MDMSKRALVALIALSLLVNSRAFAAMEIYNVENDFKTLTHYQEVKADGKVRKTENGLNIVVSSLNYTEKQPIGLGFTVPDGYRIEKILHDKDADEQQFPGVVLVTTISPQNHMTMKIILVKNEPDKPPAKSEPSKPNAKGENQNPKEPGKMQEEVEGSLDKSAKVEAIEHGVRVTLDADGIFPVNEGSLSPRLATTVRRMLSNRKPAELERIMIEGHTDSTGSYKYNMLLSQKRAAASVPVLLEMGFKPEQIVTVGYADTRPAADNSTEEGRAKNRRIEFSIIRKAR